MTSTLVASRLAAAAPACRRLQASPHAADTLAGLVVGVILVDAGMQVVNVSNQARIYSLPKEAHSRLNTVYMVSYFTGGSLGSALGVWAWDAARWTGVCALTLGATALAAVVYLAGRRRLPA